jgi:predicted AAA+ superfamily ATPase
MHLLGHNLPDHKLLKVSTATITILPIVYELDRQNQLYYILFMDSLLSLDR